MQSDITALEEMIADLLTMARIDTADKYSRVDRVHLGRLLQQIVKDASFEGVPAEKTVVQTGIFERFVLGDAGLLHSCLENVVRNALKHTRYGGIVEVKLSDDNSAGVPILIVSVSDEGPGVPEQALQLIFDPFYRIPSSDTHKKGAGLGLAISKKVTALYGGSIEARNLPAGGLEVQIRLLRAS